MSSCLSPVILGGFFAILLRAILSVSVKQGMSDIRKLCLSLLTVLLESGRGSALVETQQTGLIRARYVLHG